jgi:glycerate kinase
VARAFGPQKGATADDVERLSAALDRYAAVVERDLGERVADLPGGGASGGLGAGLVAFCGAVLRPRMEVVSRWLDLDTAIVAADLVVTAEGSLDHQTPHGKVPAEVARRAHHHGVPVIALAGTLGPGARRTLEDHTGIDAFSGILRAPCTLPEAIDRAAEWLADAAEQAVRLLLVGASIEGQRVR